MLDAKYQNIPKLHDGNAEIPSDISEFVHRLMQPQPTKRFESYEALLAAIVSLQKA